MALPDSPLTRGEQYLAKAAGQDVSLPDVPLTRAEQYLAKIAGQDVAIPNVPLTRLEQYLDYIAEHGGGGGSSITVEPLTVTSNGTQTAPSGKAYSPVTVAVPQPSGTKNIDITQNGYTTVNVLDYVSANIYTNVQPHNILAHEGKLSNILSTQSEFIEINSLLGARKIFAFVNYEFSGTPVVMPLMSAGNNDIIGMAFNTDGTMANTTGVMIVWNIEGNVTAIALMGGQLQDLSSYAPMIDARLRVYGTTAPTPAD